MTLAEATKLVIAEICRRLDGLPLAMELAAARSSLFSLPVKLDWLNDRLLLFTSGPKDQPARLQTMRDAIAWSYDLLTGDQQALFRRLSIYVGGFCLSAAVAAADKEEGAVLATLGALVDHSLVQAASDASPESRYTMLETIRDFGLNQLISAGEADEASGHHARYFMALAERIEPDIDGPHGTDALLQLDRERANMQMALARSIEHGEVECAVRLASALWRYWRIRGHLSEGRDGLTAALALAAPLPPQVRAEALWRLGYLHFVIGEFALARHHLEQSVALFSSGGNQSGAATALDSLGTVLRPLRDLPRAKDCHEKAFALRRELRDHLGMAMPLANLGVLALDRGEMAEARALLEEALAIARQSGSQREIANRLLNLSRLDLAEGQLAFARERVGHSRRIFEEIGEQIALVAALEIFGRIANEAGDQAAAIDYLTSSLSLRLRLGLHRELAALIEYLAGVADSLDAAVAVRLLAAADADRVATGIPRLERDAATWNRTVEAAKRALGANHFSNVWQAGRHLSVITAGIEAEAFPIAQTRHSSNHSNVTPAPDFAIPHGSELTPREREMLRLVVAGQNNQGIAEVLSISPATVKRHVANILAKLELPTRAAAASYPLRHGLISD